jgi:signal transduction histidine kinase
MDNELHGKAVLANEIFASVADSRIFSDKISAQAKLEKLKAQAPEVTEVSIIKKDGDNFVIIASTSQSKIDTVAEGYQADIAWKENKPVAILSSYADQSDKSIRVWSVTNLVSEGDTKLGLIDTKVSLKDIDDLVQESLRQSFLILIATIILILLLLINHFRFFERAMLVKKLQEVDQMKDDFISIASHELKTPIAAIRGYLSNIIDGVGGSIDAKAKGNIEVVDKQALRLNDLVNDLLNVSRLEQGRLQFELESLDLGKAVGEVVSSLSIQAREKSLELNYETLGDIVISADQNRLREIFTNIVGNAIKYTMSGSVNIYHVIEKDKIKTIIKDTGVGMSPEARKNLFTKFYRIKTDATKDIPGTGLGLWITKEMVEKMNGEIFVDSMENSGSQFTITFPVSKNRINTNQTNRDSVAVTNENNSDIKKS